VKHDVLRAFLTRHIPDANAVQMLMTVAFLARTLDDLADEKTGTGSHAVPDVMAYMLLDLQTNPFYAANSALFGPLLVALSVMWADTDNWKRQHEQLAMRGYIWRDGVDLLLVQVCVLLFGPTTARGVLNAWYSLTVSPDSETFTEWKAS
jgi:hypothetical protein